VRKQLYTYIPFITGLILSVGFVFVFRQWFMVSEGIPLDRRIPDKSNITKRSKAQASVTLKNEPELFDGIPSGHTGEWPGFRGTEKFNIIPASQDMPEKITPESVKELWRISVGEGYSGPAVFRGKVFLVDYMHEQKREVVRAFSLDDGKEIWRNGYGIQIKRNHGMSRTVPAVSGDYIVSIGSKCHVLCLKNETGEFVWGKNMVKEYGTKVPLWYTAQCPLLDDGVAVLAPGGKVLMTGIEIKSGKTLWSTDNDPGFAMSHSSIVKMKICGTQTYVYFAEGGLAGVSAEKDSAGTLLWHTSIWSHKVVAPSPVRLSDSEIFLTAGYGAGSVILSVERKGNDYSFTIKKSFNKSEFACEQHTPLYINGLLYTIIPNDGGEYKRQLVCMNVEGEIFWRSGKQNRYGLGPFIMIQDKLLVLNDDGLLSMVSAGINAFTHLGSLHVLHGRESWGPMAYINGHLLVRDFTDLICLNMKTR
jgi:outer membrane protein assembly factor BamB